MNFANARFLDASRHTVLVDIDGSAATVPADPSNRHYAALISSGAPIASAPVPEPTAADVRAEASRRLQVVFGARDATHLDIIIANATREVARLNQIKVGVPHPAGGWLAEPREWTAEERARLATLHGADQMLESIRAASNRLEAMQPVPADYAADDHWSGTAPN